MTRFLFLLMVFFNTAAFAAVPADLQKNLQKQFTDMKQQMQGRLTTDGDIKVTGDTITYPAMKVMVADMKSSWAIPSITLTFTGAAKEGKVPFSLTLPATFKQTHVNGTLLRSVALSGQKIAGDWSQKESTIERLDGAIDAVTWNDVVGGSTTTAEDIAVQAKTQFTQTDKVNVLLHAQTKKFSRMPASFASGLMPQKSELTGQIKTLPKALVMFGALVPIPGLQSTLAQMGTRFDIDDVNATTANGAQIKGNGWFKAADAASALPVSGRMTVQLKNLQQVLTTLQQSFSAGTGNRGEAAQSMVMLMMLQGMGKGVGQDTRYVVDMTPEGQVILNGQDVTAMFVGDRSLLKFFKPQAKTSTDAPVVPNPGVVDEGNI